MAKWWFLLAPLITSLAAWHAPHARFMLPGEEALAGSEARAGSTSLQLLPATEAAAGPRSPAVRGCSALRGAAARGFRGAPCGTRLGIAGQYDGEGALGCFGDGTGEFELDDGVHIMDQAGEVGPLSCRAGLCPSNRRLGDPLTPCRSALSASRHRPLPSSKAAPREIVKFYVFPQGGGQLVWAPQPAGGRATGARGAARGRCRGGPSRAARQLGPALAMSGRTTAAARGAPTPRSASPTRRASASCSPERRRSSAAGPTGGAQARSFSGLRRPCPWASHSWPGAAKGALLASGKRSAGPRRVG